MAVGIGRQTDRIVGHIQLPIVVVTVMVAGRRTCCPPGHIAAPLSGTSFAWCQCTAPDTAFSIMEAFAPDFSHYWLTAQGNNWNGPTSPFADDEPVSPSQREALDALVERINAARSIV